MFFCRFSETLKKISLTSFQTYIFSNIFRKLRQWKLSLSNFGHISSIVFEVIKTILSPFTFFLQNDFERKKRKSNQNQQNKNKRTKNNKGNNFLCTKTSKRGKIVYFVFFFYLKYLLKKIEIDNLIYYTTENMRFLTLLLSNYFYLFSSIHKTLLLNCQNKWLIPHGTFKNAGSKPVRGRFRGCGTLTSKEVLGT